MRVLLIDVNCKYSSTGKIVYSLYTGINSNGDTAAICYGRGPRVDEPYVYKFSSKAEVYKHALLTRITGFTGRYSPFATRRLIDFIDEFQPDVVHIHELHGYFVDYTAVINYLKENNIKTIWTFHCEFMYTGKCGQAHECDKWMSQCADCPQVRSYPASIVFDRTREMFDEKRKLFNDFTNITIVTPSKWLGDRVRCSFLKDKDIRVIPNGIDTTNTFYPRETQHLKEKHHITDEKVLLAVAPNLLSEQKGGKWVLDLASRLRDQRVRTILIGINERDGEYDDNIVALGRVENQERLAEYYSMADLFVICSKNETFPTTCLEALCCGTPVIGFDVGGTRETAPDGYGLFVEYGDIESLSARVESFFSGEVKLKSQSECEAFGKKHYSNTVMVDNYLQVYNLDRRS